MSQVKKTLVHETKPVTAGAVLTYTIPSFRTIDDIILTFTNNGAACTEAQIRAAIGKVALNINGEQIINTPISTIYDCYKYLGVEVWQSNPANAIGLMIGNRVFKNILLEKLFAIGCRNVQTIQLQVYCNAAVANVTDLQVSTLRRNFESDTASLVKIIDYPQTATASGISTVDTLPHDNNDAYLFVMASNGGGTIVSGEAIVNGETVIDPVDPSTMGYVAAARGRQPLEDYFVYDFADGSEAGTLPMQGATELRFKTNFDGAPTSGNYDLVAVSVKNLPQILLNATLA